MKEITVAARIPADEAKGTAEASAVINVKYAETVKEAVEMFGEEAVLSNAFNSWRVTLQSNIRSGLRKAEAPEAITARLANAKMGVTQTGVKIDPIQSYLAIFQNSTPEKQAEMLADLKKQSA